MAARTKPTTKGVAIADSRTRLPRAHTRARKAVLETELASAREGIRALTNQLEGTQSEVLILRQQLEVAQTEIATRIKALEQAKISAAAELERQMAARSQFFAKAAHDLRNPIQPVGDLLVAAAKRLEDGNTDAALEHITIARKATSDLRRSFNTVLELGRLQSGNVTPSYTDFDLRHLVDEVVCRMAPDVTNREMNGRFPRVASSNFVTGCLISDVTGGAGSRGVRHQP